jgi:hypothetical protein
MMDWDGIMKGQDDPLGKNNHQNNHLPSAAPL